MASRKPQVDLNAERNAKTLNTRRKKISMQKINLAVYTILLCLVILVMIVLIPLIFVLHFTMHETEHIAGDIHNIVDLHENLFQLKMISSTIYEYVQYNNSTKIMNNPIGQEWEYIYSNISMGNGFLKELLTEQEEQKNAELHVLLQDSLCKGLNIDVDMCGILKKEAVEQGIIGLNTFFLLTMRTVKDMFDLSDRSFAEAKKTLSYQDLIFLEILQEIIVLPTYQRLSQILETKVEAHFLASADLILQTCILSSVLNFIVGIFILRWFSKKINYEKTRWKKMLRKIPISIMISNKVLSSYVEKEYSQVFSNPS